MKKIIILLLLLYTLPVFAQGIEDAIDTPQKIGSSYQHHEDNHHDNGGFRKETKILDTKYLFISRKLQPSDFDTWLKVFHQAIAIETFTLLLEKNRIAADGEAFNDIKFGNYFVPKGNLFLISAYKKDVRLRFSYKYLMAELRQVDIIDEEGFLVDLSEQEPIAFEEVDFEDLQLKLSLIELPILDEDLAKNMKKDLFRLISSTQKVNEVTKLTTTHYESHKSNIFTNILDSVVGNFVGSLVHPDQTSVSVHTTAWQTTVNPYTYFDHLEYGFNHAPFHRNGPDLRVINGQDTCATITLSQMNEHQKTATELDISWLLKTEIKSDKVAKLRTAVNYFKLNLNFERFCDEYSSPIFFTPALGGGTAGDKYAWEALVGLTFKDGKKSANALGWAMGLNATYYIQNPFSFDFSWSTHQQPNIFNSTINWQYHRTSFGFSLHVNQIQLQAGYRIYNASEVVFLNGWYFGFKYWL